MIPNAHRMLNFDLGETADAIRETVHAFSQNEIAPRAAEIDRSNQFPRDLWPKIGALGLHGITVEEEYGGAGMNARQYARFVETLAWAAPGFRSLLTINIGMVTTALVSSGTEAQRRDYLPRLAGGAVACFGLTEPDSGSDAAALKTRAVRDGGHYVLNGVKRYITNAPFAEVGLIMARTARENLPRNAHVSAFLVPMDAKGVGVGAPDKKMGQAGSQIADIVLEDVRVPASALLGALVGLAIDGVGLGPDGGAWGGELLRLEGMGCERLGHVQPLRLPGGDRAAREPWRMAVSALHDAGLAYRVGGWIRQYYPGRDPAPLLTMLDRNLRCPSTTSRCSTPPAAIRRGSTFRGR